MRIFTKFNEEEILKIYKEYNLEPKILPLVSTKLSEELSLLLEHIIKNRPLFENKRKFLRISELHLYNYLESIASAKRILLKSNINYYDNQLASAGLTKIRLDNVNYYVAK